MRRTCPTDSELIALFMAAPASHRSDRLLRHLASCARCTRRFQVLREVKRDLAPHVEAFVASVEPGSGAPPRTHPGLRFHRWAFAALLVLVVGTAGVYLALTRIQARSELRSASPSLLLLSPVGEVRKVPGLLRWKPFVNAESYFLEIVDEGLERLYQGSTYLITEIRLPPEVRGRLAAGRTYVWTVSARDGDGNMMATRSAAFVIK